jgi:hypothetical protein
LWKSTCSSKLYVQLPNRSRTFLHPTCIIQAFLESYDINMESKLGTANGIFHEAFIDLLTLNRTNWENYFLFINRNGITCSFQALNFHYSVKLEKGDLSFLLIFNMLQTATTDHKLVRTFGVRLSFFWNIRHASLDNI